MLVLPTESYMRAQPALTGGLPRTPERAAAVARQFNVAAEERYCPGHMSGPHATFCNIFAWDYTSAMGAEAPHWVDDAGMPAAPGAGHKELNANALRDWLASYAGLRCGWRRVDAHEAGAESAKGSPVLVIWKNPNASQPGHVAVLLPDGTIAQAGSRCFYGEPLVHGFGYLPVEFYAHA